ncbi:hypothetical protein SAMN05192532_1038 [Alteribacillus iranensis]|uniref:Uncharacterized protein n=2 Tax=Alteribacillus iranensis TaxID=930128 RepID=A0A1I2CJ71_9BACI|nr:hypothetical protein SAMN05192532_1038 [Alteribacillus iranensis]
MMKNIFILILSAVLCLSVWLVVFISIPWNQPEKHTYDQQSIEELASELDKSLGVDTLQEPSDTEVCCEGETEDDVSYASDTEVEKDHLIDNEYPSTAIYVAPEDGSISLEELMDSME